jgi:hypothetical protein
MNNLSFNYRKVCEDSWSLQWQTSWTLSIVQILIKNDISETGICLRRQAKPTLLGSFDSACHYVTILF